MARVKGALATRKRRKKTLKLAKGYFGAKSKLFKTAKEAVMKSGNYAYIGRRLKKRDFRRLWITRISAAAKINGMNYSSFTYDSAVTSWTTFTTDVLTLTGSMDCVDVIPRLHNF